MSLLQLAVTAILTIAGIALQIWSSALGRAERQYALQLPSVLLYSLASALFLFTAFPDSLTEGKALGFGLSGAAGFAAFFMLISFTWLAKTRRRDELSAQLKRAQRENTSLRRQLVRERSSGEGPRPLAQSTRYDVPLRGNRRHRIGVVTGNLADVLGVDVWVNPENTRMEMSRVDEPTVSAAIRYNGGCRDNAGHLVDDVIAKELAEQMDGRQHVSAGQVLVTGAGELLESHQVRKILHVAAVEGEPGSGYRQVMDLARCARNILAEVDRLTETGEPLRSVVLPLLGTGGGNSDLHRTVDTLLAATVSYFEAHSASRIRVVYLLAYTDVQEAVCRTALDSHPELTTGASAA
ncbi:macro domain-containing protein [Streptomyces luteogriseus]|uniref:macro domain-containing protein n=1 Tax=Streptomyces luteogriseus TaxID=68233 RepID=UPI002E2FCAF1|nr:macro domain-containing protein [Streptomyces luteogriseus]WTJ29459.1 macro domain-containing protein [Streptomyces luteogriseus]